MKLTKKLLASALALLLVLTAIPMYGMEAEAAQKLTSGDYEYTVNEDGASVTITGYLGYGGDITIPSEIEGKKVSRINGYAFSYLGCLTGVTIPDSVTSIDSIAFPIAAA